VPDREIAARLAALRRAGVDLELRVRGDVSPAADAAAYWQAQVAAWRAEIEAALEHYPFQLRAVQAPIGDAAAGDAADAGRWSSGVLHELSTIRGRLDATIERLTPDD
jgi:hypothetical protein